jgi:dienelactone hydrolase
MQGHGHGFARLGSAHHDAEAAALADRRTERFFAEDLPA